MIFLPLILMQVQAKPVTPAKALIFGEQYMFRVEIPNGWEFKEAKTGGGTVTAKDGGGVKVHGRIEIGIERKKGQKRGALEAAIDQVLTKEKEAVPGSKAIHGADIRTYLDVTAYGFYVEPKDTNDVRRCLMFVDSPKVAVWFKLVADTPDDYNAALAAYVPLIKSYVFVTDNVHAKKS